MTGKPRINRIPAEEWKKVVNEYLDSQGDPSNPTDRGNLLASLSERLDVNPNSFYNLLRGRGATVDFDFADEVLCALNLQHHWWGDGPLAEIYQEVKLVDNAPRRPPASVSGKVVCAHVACATKFLPVREDHKFCCTRCRHRQRSRDQIEAKRVVIRRPRSTYVPRQVGGVFVAR